MAALGSARQVHLSVGVGVPSLRDAGVVANELAAVIRWRAGKRLDSPALIADGNHARADGLVSGGVILSASCIGLGFPLADPPIGLGITGLIFKSTWASWRTIRTS